jgi:uncharacterized membrane protein HdeD (DUF308 family)
MNKSTKGIWLSVVITGIFTVVIGLLILGAPILMRGSIRPMVAIMLLLGGLSQGLYTLLGRGMLGLKRPEDVVLSWLLTIIPLIVGILVLVHPLDTFMTFTTLMAMFFGVEGALRIGKGYGMRPHKLFILPIILGIISIIFCLLIFYLIAGVPEEIIIDLLGLTFIARGFVTLLLGFAAKEILKHAETEPEA